MQSEKYNASVLHLVNRFLDRVVAFDPDFSPRDHLLYLSELDLLYRYRDGVYLELDYKRGFPTYLLAFLEHELDPANFPPSPDDPDKTLDGYLPINPKLNINTDLLNAMQRLIPLKLDPSRCRKDANTSLITFNDNMVLNLGDPNFPLLPASPDLYSFLKLDFPSSMLGGDADQLIRQQSPRFLQFLDEVLVCPYDETSPLLRPHDPLTLSILHSEGFMPDETLQDFVQEVLGYTLLDGIKSQSAFFFHGEGQNGKSRLLTLLRSFFPENVVSFLRISDITNEFKTSMLIGKKINIANEEESKDIRIDVLKNLISGEPMPANRKFRDAISFTPTTKFIFSLNDLPPFERLDFALKRRLHIIPFKRIVPDALKDIFLDEKLAEERSGVLRWMIEGAKRFQQRGSKFAPPSSVTNMFGEMVEERFPAIRFFHEFFEVSDNPEDRFESLTMYNQYRTWATQNGYTGLLNERNFGKQIYSISPKIKRVRMQRKDTIDRPWGRSNIKPHKPSDPLPLPQNLLTS